MEDTDGNFEAAVGPNSPTVHHAWHLREEGAPLKRWPPVVVSASVDHDGQLSMDSTYQIEPGHANREGDIKHEPTHCIICGTPVPTGTNVLRLCEPFGDGAWSDGNGNRQGCCPASITQKIIDVTVGLDTNQPAARACIIQFACTRGRAMLEFLREFSEACNDIDNKIDVAKKNVLARQGIRSDAAIFGGAAARTRAKTSIPQKRTQKQVRMELIESTDRIRLLFSGASNSVQDEDIDFARINENVESSLSNFQMASMEVLSIFVHRICFRLTALRDRWYNLALHLFCAGDIATIPNPPRVYDLASTSVNDEISPPPAVEQPAVPEADGVLDQGSKSSTRNSASGKHRPAKKAKGGPTEQNAVRQVFVKTQNGPVITIEVAEPDTIQTVKAKIQTQAGFPPDRQRIIHAGKELEDDTVLANVDHGCDMFT